MQATDRPTINRLATGAPGSITLGGTKYLVGQPTDQDHATLGAELKKIADRQRQGRLVQLVKELGTVAAAKEVLDATEPPAILDGPDERANAAAFQRLIFTAAGCRFLAWLLMRKPQPDLTLEHVRKLITEDNATAVAIQLLHESGMADLDPNSAGGTGSLPSRATPVASGTT